MKTAGETIAMRRLVIALAAQIFCGTSATKHASDGQEGGLQPWEIFAKGQDINVQVWENSQNRRRETGGMWEGRFGATTLRNYYLLLDPL